MPVTQTLIRTPKEWADWIIRVNECSYVSFDSEYEDHGFPRWIIVGISMSIRKPGGHYEKVYVPLNHYTEFAGTGQWVRDPNQLTPDQVRPALQKLVNSKKLVIMHNAQADLKVMHLLGVDTDPINLFDTMIASWMLETDREVGHGLKPLTYEFFGYRMKELTEFCPKEFVEDRTKPRLKSGKRKGQYQLKSTGVLLVTRAPIADAVIYASDDAYYTLRLYRKFRKQLEAEGYTKLYKELFMEVIHYLVEMEEHGMVIDRPKMKVFIKRCKKIMRREERIIFNMRPGKMQGVPLNLGSQPQLNAMLFGAYKKIDPETGKKSKKVYYSPERAEFDLEPKGEPGKSGYYGTSAEVMEDYAYDGHEVADHIVAWSTAKHHLGMVRGWLKRAVKHADGTWRLHGHFNMHGTRTGRLSSSDPNLQNIPVRDPDYPAREGFVGFHTIVDGVRHWYVFGDHDYSQIELKILAHISQDKRMMAIMLAGGDLHSETAAIAYHLKVPKDLVDLKLRGKFIKQHFEEFRGKAKGVNFGTVYGIGPRGLARKQGMSLKEAEDFLANHPKIFPQAHKWIRRRQHFAAKFGYIKTIFGRKRHLPEAMVNPRKYPRGDPRAQKAWVMFNSAMRRAVNSTIQGSAGDIILKAMRNIRRRFKAMGVWYKFLDEGKRVFGVIPGAQVHDELVNYLLDEKKDEYLAIITEEMNKAVRLRVPTEAEGSYGNNWIEAKG